jgi:cell division protein FtsW
VTAFTNPLRATRHAARPPTKGATKAATRSSTAVLLVATVAVLNVVGVVMVLSASSVASLTDYGSPWYFFFRQIMWTALGLVAFVFAVRFDYRRWRALVRPLLIASVALLLVVLVPGVGIYVSGSRRWLGMGIFRFQPSEIAKLALLLYAADLVSRRGGELHDWRRVVRPVLLVLGLCALLVMKEPDLGSTMVLAIVVLAVLVAGGVKKRHLAVVFGLGITAVTFLALAEPYRRTRMLTFLDPFKDSSNAGYQISQSLIALGSGGLTGVGLGAGRAKWNFLPNAHTDFIFAIIGEELGLIGCLLVMGLFVAFAVLGARAALRAPDRFGALLAAGVTVWVVGQAVINIGAVVGLLPVTGIPLPFVSFGGSALITTMLATGILVNVARQGRLTQHGPGRATPARAPRAAAGARR